MGKLLKRYYITDRKAVGGFRPLLEIIRDQMHLGVDFVQIREKDLTAREIFEFTLAVLETRDTELPKHLRPKILINSRADIALATGADGVHLPSDAPAQTLGRLLVFRSCHTLEEVKQAQSDFVTFGPVFDTPSKGKGVGLDALRDACRLGKPVFALGGVDWDNAADCMEAGAKGIAGIRLFQDPTL
ncbi:MAG: thiamine phosphate synthase [Bryobacteraceae bacterium]